jgi:hypothetical protein
MLTVYVLFDTGVHRDAIAEPVGGLGEARARWSGVRSGVLRCPEVDA